MTQTPAPREDALALLAEVSRGLKQCRSCIRVSSQLRERIRAALSAPPSQSESDDMRQFPEPGTDAWVEEGTQTAWRELQADGGLLVNVGALKMFLERAGLKIVSTLPAPSEPTAEGQVVYPAICLPLVLELATLRDEGATLMTEDEIVEAMMVAANDVINEDDTFHAGAMRAALRIAIPWAREQALREAARICNAVNNHDNPMTAGDCADAILALIPCRQEPR